jgi:outer membrane protein OmpA-like peptidoglycan-associated protein
MLENTDISVYIIDPETKDTIYLSSFKPDSNVNFDITLDKNNEYKILVSNTNINPKSFIIDTRDKDPNVNNMINQGRIGIEALPAENIKINVFYEFNSSKITEESKNSLDTISNLMLKLPNISLLVSAHTDNKGSDTYNQTLSQKRANNIKDYLIKKGIEKSRIEAKGLGETMPIAPNENPDGSDNPDGRTKNRRTEIKFVKQEMLTE